MAMAAAALPVLGSIASSLMNGVSNVLSMRSQRDYDLQSLREAREYNSPKNQKARLREAGINPALAMTNGMMSSGTMDQTSGGQSPMQYDFSPIAQGMRDSADLFLQRRYQNAQIDMLHQQTVNQSIKNKFENDRQIIELTKMLSEKGLTDENRKHIETVIDGLKKENVWIDKRNASMINRNDQEAALAHQKALTEDFMRDVNKRLAESNIKLNQAQISVFNQQVKMIAEEVTQMILNGASNRKVQSFIADRERETSRLLFKQNDTYQQEFDSKMGLQKAQTEKLGREHTTNSFTIFGIPFGTRETITDWKNGRPLGPLEAGYGY